MKKFLCLIFCMLTVASATSCMPPRRETEAEKRTKQIIAEENAKLDEILKRSRETENIEETTDN